MKSIAVGSTLLAVAQAAAIAKRAVTPQLLSATFVGNMTDATLNRDSCAASLFNGRALWTCRDTQPVVNGQAGLPVSASSASWTAMSGGLPVASNGILAATGNNDNKPFYPIDIYTNCGEYGVCSDGTRYALWPDQPPMVTETTAAGVVTAYTFIKTSHLKGLTGLGTPPCSLYRVDYDPSKDTNLPVATIVETVFWDSEYVPYGDAGFVVHNGIAYLYGASTSGVALAKVPVGSVENKSAYQYYVNGAWTKTLPLASASGINLENFGSGGQGTVYYSSHWNSFVWIGGSEYPGAAMYISTAPHPKGPWTPNTNFWTGPDGDSGLGAYSVQANPALGNPKGNGIYVSYTAIDDFTGTSLYYTPVYEILWK